MASNNTQGYQPIALPDWQELLQSLADCIGDFQANRPQKDKIDAKSRACLIRHYILDLEICLKGANDAILFYEALSKNYDRLISVIGESRNQAYDIIGRLKDEIAIAKKYRPLADGVQSETPRSEKEDSDE
jgi:hypothetical protein